MTKSKIVLDADVIIHFYKGGFLTLLPKIFPEYQYIVLSHVYKEIKGNVKSQLDNQVYFLKDISIIEFEPKGEMLLEYAQLIKVEGREKAHAWPTASTIIMYWVAAI